MVSIRERVRRFFRRRRRAPAPKQSFPRKQAPVTQAPQSTPSGPRIVDVRTGEPIASTTPGQFRAGTRARGRGGSAPTPTQRPTVSPKKIIRLKPGIKPTISQQRQLLEQKQRQQQKLIKQIQQEVPRRVEIAKAEAARRVRITTERLKRGLEVERKRKEVARRKFVSGFKEKVDVISGGAFSSRKIGKDQEKLNKEVETFNKQFSGKELARDQFERALKREAELRRDQQKLKQEQEKLDASKRKKFGQLIFGLPGTKIRSLTEPERQKVLKENKGILKTANKQLQNKKINPIKKKVVEARKRNAQFQISKIESGKDIKTGIVGEPVIFAPVGLPFAIGKLAVSFVGSQTTKGGKIITTVALKSNKGIEGFATGTTTRSGKTFVTITKGRFGTRAIKFPTGKTGIVKRRVFVAVEKVITKKDVFALRRTTDILKKNRKIGKIKTIQTNIKGLVQAGKGRVIVGRGRRLVKTTLKIPTGKLVTKKKRGLAIDDFASVSAIIPKKDLSLIIGRTITSKGDRAKFIGLIKGSGKLGKGKDGGLSRVQQQQFRTALKTVLSSATSAVAKADKAKGLTKAQKLALASTQIIPSPKIITPKKPTRPSLKVVPRPRFKGVPLSTLAGRGPQFEFQPTLRVASGKLNVLDKRLGQRGLSIKQKNIIKEKQSQVKRQLVNQLNRQKQRVLQRTKQRQRQLATQLQSTRLTQRQKQILRQRTKVVQRQITRLRSIRITPRFSIPRITRILKPIRGIPLRAKGIIRRKKKVVRLRQAYNVKARPRRIKGRKIPKLIKVNKVPLSKRDARNLRNKVLDESLGRTGRIVKTRGKPQKPKLPVNRNFAKRTDFKFRTHKKVKGRRVPLPKGKVIEKSKHLLDTRSEKKQITLRRKIAQLNKQAEAKTRTKRKLSQKQLDALAQGRKKRLQNIGKRRKR